MRIRKGCKYIYTDEERELVRRLFDPEAYADILADVSKARLEQGV